MPQPPSTPTTNPNTPYSYTTPTLSTIPGPQLTTRYGPNSHAPPSTPTPTLMTVQGPQLTTRYTLPGMPRPAGAPSSIPRPTVNPHLPRSASQGSFYQSYTPTATGLPPLPTSASTPTMLSSSGMGVMSATGVSLPGQSAGSSGLTMPSVGGSASAAAAAAAATATAAAAGRGGGRKPMTLRGSFAKELHALMYACGDDANPAGDTVNVMEEMLIEYIEQLAITALKGQTKPKLTVDGLRRALSRPGDKEKLGRLNDLVYRAHVIKAARRGWKDPY